MSKYTTEVRWICESKSGFTMEELSQKSVDQIIGAAWNQIFDFSMDFYNAAWNEKIAKFILKYYYTREIGSETVGLWKLRLNARCAEISGKYKPMITMFETLEPADYFHNYDFAGGNTRTDNLKSKRTDNLTMKQEGENKDKFSDTPQNGLTSVENGSYLTNYRNIETENEVKNTGDQTTDNTGTQSNAYNEKGYRGAETLAGYAAQLDYERFNILQQIAEEFSDLFMLLW